MSADQLYPFNTMRTIMSDENIRKHQGLKELTKLISVIAEVMRDKPFNETHVIFDKSKVKPKVEPVEKREEHHE